MKKISLAIILIATVSNCTRIPSSKDADISAIIENRIDATAVWHQNNNPDTSIENSIQCLIDNELTADSAIQIALLHNPQVQATFEELGIAQADLLAAGLLSNPSFEIEVRYPHTHSLHTNIEYLITSSLLDIFLIPLRTKVAKTEFEQIKLKVSNEILNLAFDVRETFYELIGEKKEINIFNL